jgi:hypothetical protein
VNEDKKKLARKMHLRVVGDSKPKRILFVSNAPWASTGYGQQTAQLTTRLKKDEYEVAIAANYGLEASNSDWNTEAGSIPVYSRGHEQWSNDVIPAHMYDWTQKDPDAQHLLMTLFDVWVFKGDKWADWPVASWVPVDHLPCPPDVSAWCRKKNVWSSNARKCWYSSVLCASRYRKCVRTNRNHN